MRLIEKNIKMVKVILINSKPHSITVNMKSNYISDQRHYEDIYYYQLPKSVQKFMNHHKIMCDEYYEDINNNLIQHITIK